MVFKSIKETFRTRRNRSRPPSTMPAFNVEVADEQEQIERRDNADRLQETINVLRSLGHSMSSKNIRLPPLPSFKPLNLSNMELFKSKDDPVSAVPPEIRRKPCRVVLRDADTSTITSTAPTTTPVEVLAQKSRAFDPCAPITNPHLHKRAREALKRRYESKFTIEFEPPTGVSVKEYNFMWCDEAKLDLKVLEDIVWVRERYQQAKKDEPNDEDIIRWYDAERFDVGGCSGTASTFEGSFQSGS